MINICIPVLKRYDLLRGLLDSLGKGSVTPSMVHVIDNGRDAQRVRLAVGECSLPIDIWTPDAAYGVAESWNWFIDNVPEERVIVNDDVIFGATSLEQLVAAKGDLIFAKDVGFSCFLIRDTCIEKIGMFDEQISPGYGYYEDEDYLQRIDGKGTKPPQADLVDVSCGIVHLKSQTLASAGPKEMREHHRRFSIAQANYIKKWHLEGTFR